MLVCLLCSRKCRNCILSLIFQYIFAVVKSSATRLSPNLVAKRISFPRRPPVDGCCLSCPELPVQQTLTSRCYSDQEMHRTRRNLWLFYVLPIAALSVPPCFSFETPKTRGLADNPTPACRPNPIEITVLGDFKKYDFLQ